MNKNAVTIQVGMILILFVISLSMGLIFTNYRVLTESMVATNHEIELKNSIILLHANLEKVAFGDFSARVTELKTYTGYISIVNNSYMLIGNTTFYLGEIVYADDEKNFKLVIENDAIFAIYGNGSIIVANPRMMTAGSKKFIHAIQFVGQGSTSGRGVLRIRAENNGGGVFTTSKNITLHSDYAGLWKEILENNGFNTTLIGDKDLLIHNPGEITVKSVIISLSLLR